VSYRQWEIPIEALSAAQRQGLAYWRSLSDPHHLPAIKDFDLLGFPPEVLPTTHIVDVIDGGAEFKYRFWGSGFRDHFGYDGTGMTYAELRPQEIREPVRAATRRIVDERRPLAMMSEFKRGPLHDTQGFQRIIRMPLVSAAGAVDQIVSIVEFLQDYRESQRIIAEVKAERF